MLGVLLTSMYCNPEKTKEIINKTIDFMTQNKEKLPEYKQKLQKEYQINKDLLKGW